MKIPREATNRIRNILDNYVPPVIRDTYWFMYLPARILFGKYASLFLNFRSHIHTYTSREYDEIYKTVNPLYSRETDLTSSAVDYISQRIAGETVLEVGSGRGLLAKNLSKHCNVTAMDIVIDNRLIGLAHIHTKQGHVEHIPFADKSFDTVICTHTLEHILDFQKAVSELRRVSRKRLIIVVPMQRPYKYSLDLHVQFFPYPESLITAFNPPKSSHYTCKNIDGDLYYDEEKVKGNI